MKTISQMEVEKANLCKDLAIREEMILSSDREIASLRQKNMKLAMQEEVSREENIALTKVIEELKKKKPVSNEEITIEYFLDNTANKQD